MYGKFRNERRLIDDPEVILHKRRRTEESKAVASKLRRGGINWEPPFPEGEDEASLKKHKQFMQNEWARRAPDIEKINRRMA